MADFIVGNDIASFQGDVNYDTYKNNSNFVIFKATEGVGFTDPKLSRNQSEARRVGLPLGYYHFARPDLNNTAKSEADFFLAQIGELQNGEVLCLDYEASWSGDVVGWCKVWLDHILEKTGCKPLIYLNQSHMSLDWKPIVDAGYGLWIAAYTYDPNNNTANIGDWPFAAMQQWTNKQSVPGISGNVDGDVFFGDAVAFKKYGYQNQIIQPPADPCATQNQLIETLNSQIATLQVTVSNQEKALTSDKDTINSLSEQANLVPNLKKQVQELTDSRKGYMDEASACQTQLKTIEGKLIPKKPILLKIYNLIMSLE